MQQFASRAGNKLQFAFDTFNISVTGLTCADFGSSTGGFVDCLLKNGAKKVYAVEVGYGNLDWNLRNDPRVLVMERTNAMHIKLPEKVDFISIDTGWTKQKMIVPNALANLKTAGVIISLIKPQYESEAKFVHKGKVIEEQLEPILEKVKSEITLLGVKVSQLVESPIVGEKGKNKEFLALIRA